MESVPVPTGILMVPFALDTPGREALRDRWLAWAADPSRPVALDSGIRFRALLPDGTFEPDYPPAEPIPPDQFGTLVPLEQTGTIVPWSMVALCASGWLVALASLALR